MPVSGDYQKKKVLKNIPASLRARFRLLFFDFTLAGTESERTSPLSSSSSVTVVLDGRLLDTAPVMGDVMWGNAEMMREVDGPGGCVVILALVGPGST